ncbi:VanW family protein [Natroniella sulfidigena]|uniref:VanW family protein n=1 Tax=Natroniella sulfidigena TaxID=723921 RepID=UPI002009F6B4|nr:VanW family protein [Natroniella sulfidigena]MCK8816469.1 VanW family protein [Natroniella sulfidigena]
MTEKMSDQGGIIYVVQRGAIILVIIILVVILLLSLLGELDKVRRVIWGVEDGVSYYQYDLSGYLSHEVEELLLEHSQELILYPVDATLDQESGEIIPEAFGQILDITATKGKIVEAEEGEYLESVLERIEPYIRKEQLEKITKEIGVYTTRATGSESRRENIKLATESINNQLILSGEVFSFNEIVGPRTKERGFKEAPQIVNGRLVPGVGGGICQVSSTLYNALKQDKLEIIERHTHSKDVSYVPEGKDATVAWDYFDFKFKNNFKQPIIIKASSGGGYVTVRILGYQE